MALLLFEAYYDVAWYGRISVSNCLTGFIQVKASRNGSITEKPLRELFSQAILDCYSLCSLPHH